MRVKSRGTSERGLISHAALGTSYTNPFSQRCITVSKDTYLNVWPWTSFFICLGLILISKPRTWRGPCLLEHGGPDWSRRAPSTGHSTDTASSQQSWLSLWSCLYVIPALYQLEDKQTAHVVSIQTFHSDGRFNPIFSKDLFGWVPLTVCFAKLTPLVRGKLSAPEHGLLSFYPYMARGLLDNIYPHPDSQGTEPAHSPAQGSSPKKGSMTILLQKSAGSSGAKFLNAQENISFYVLTRKSQL